MTSASVCAALCAAISYSPYPLRRRLLYIFIFIEDIRILSHSGYKNTFYKNHRGSISQILRISLRIILRLDHRTQKNYEVQKILYLYAHVILEVVSFLIQAPPFIFYRILKQF